MILFDIQHADVMPRISFHSMPVNMTVISLPPHWSEVSRAGPDGSQVSTYMGRDYLIMKAISETLNFSINPLKGWDIVSWDYIFDKVDVGTQIDQT